MALAKDEREAAARGEGCLGKAADDEPVFVLRASDRFAPGLIDHWANQAHAAGVPDNKVAEAVQLADAMRVWQRRNGSKTPD